MEIVKSLDSMGQTMEGTPSFKELLNLECNEDGSVKLGKYNENVGFHSINNPGWIKYELDKEYEISYIRLLLWDNCGDGKKQPSNRTYRYRILYSQDTLSSESVRWKVLYDTMRNGSNGWQEFYLEDKPAKIRSVMVHCYYNSRNDDTQIVRVQAFKYPTKELAQEFGLKGISDEDFAPSIHGIINNRIICGYQAEAGISKGIYQEVSSRLDILEEILGDNDNDIQVFRNETKERLGELNFIDNDISRFQASLLKPVEEAVKKQKVMDRKWQIFNISVAALAIVTIVIDIVRLFR